MKWLCLIIWGLVALVPPVWAQEGEFLSATTVVAASGGGGGGGNGLLNNLYAVYRMEQADITDASDSVGSHTLTRSGATARDSTHIEGSFANNGGTSAYWTSSDTAFNTNGNWSWSAWVSSPNDLDFLITAGAGAKNWGVLFDTVGTFSGGAAHYKVFARNAANDANYFASSTVTISGAGFHHVQITYTLSDLKFRICVDGETPQATPTTDGIDASGQNFRLGFGAVIMDENHWWVNRVLGQSDALLEIGTFNPTTQTGTILPHSGGGWQN